MELGTVSPWESRLELGKPELDNQCAGVLSHRRLPLRCRARVCRCAVLSRGQAGAPPLAGAPQSHGRRSARR
eukprot:3005919-Alexandrium_andersonii.AAC.1